MAIVLNPYAFVAASSPTLSVLASGYGSTGFNLTGATAGSLVIVTSYSIDVPTISGGDGGWSTSLNFSNNTRVLQKVITSGDIGSTLTMNDTTQVIWFQLNMTSLVELTNRANGSDSPATSYTMTGFTKNLDHLGLYSVCRTGTPVGPSGWTAVSYGGAYGLSHKLNGTYVNNDSITWTGSGGDITCNAIEIREL